jgi:transcriptional regulator with XRE-family HTH domain
MESGTLKEIIAVIRADQQRRLLLLNDNPDFAYEQWIDNDEPLINELCLMLLITLRHQVERDLVGFAALAADNGKAISAQEYEERVRQLRKFNKKSQSIGWKWDDIEARLNLKSCQEYKSVEALRLLANSYKHDPSLEPSEELKDFLDLPRVSYLALPASGLFREKLAASIGLAEDALYCDIAECFVDLAVAFLGSVKGRIRLSTIKPRLVSATDFAY